MLKKIRRVLKKLFNHKEDVQDCGEDCGDCEDCEEYEDEDIEEGLNIVGHLRFNLQENGKIQIECDCAFLDDYSALTFGQFLWFIHQEESILAIQKYLIDKAKEDMVIQPFVLKVLETWISLNEEDAPIICPCEALKIGHPTSNEQEDF